MAKKKKDLKIYIPLVIVLAIVMAGAVYWYVDYSRYIKTDDALITSDVITVSPKIMGRISKIYAEEGDSVKNGELLVELDSTDLLAQRQQTISNRLQAQAGKAQAEAKYQYDIKSTDVLKINVDRAKEDFDRAKEQYNGGVLSREQFDHLQKAYETAQAQYAAAQAQTLVSKTQIQFAETSIASSQAQIDVINTQLKNTRLYAPANGLVAKRWLLPGDIASPGQSIFTINNNTRFWVMVYLEETKMGELHTGQPVKIKIDMYPDVTFTGKIFMIGSTTASQFSLIPPSNASGNFTKVTQRVPLKISIDEVETGEKLSSFRMMTGMSAVVKILR
jgi:membrane fusion protein, multidrug efflux system